MSTTPPDGVERQNSRGPDRIRAGLKHIPALRCLALTGACLARQKGGTFRDATCRSPPGGTGFAAPPLHTSDVAGSRNVLLPLVEDGTSATATLSQMNHARRIQLRPATYPNPPGPGIHDG